MNKEELINLYFEKQLSVEQQQEFDNLLKTDEHFYQEFQFQKNLKKAIALEERAELKKQFASFEEKSSARIFPMKIFAIAASLLLLVTLGSILFLNQKTDYGALYAENFQEFPNISRPIVRSGTLQSETDKAFAAYDKQDYKTATLLFSKTKSDEAYFYKGISEMTLGNYENAATDFSKINKEIFPLKEHLLWYEALNYLKLNNPEKAKQNLKPLSEKGIYKEKAKEILEELYKLPSSD